MIRALIAIGIALLLSLTHWASYQIGAHYALANALAPVVGSRYADAAAVVLDRASTLAGNAYNQALRQSIKQCTADIEAVNATLKGCTGKLGVLIDTHAKQVALATAAQAEEQRIYVRYQKDLEGRCADWAAQPICPQLVPGPGPPP